jgi:hypothetical protein
MKDNVYASFDAKCWMNSLFATDASPHSSSAFLGRPYLSHPYLTDLTNTEVTLMSSGDEAVLDRKIVAMSIKMSTIIN